MGWFDCFRKKVITQGDGFMSNRIDSGDKLVAIAEFISGNDPLVMEEITKCIADTRGYFSTHQVKYEERGIGMSIGFGVIRCGWVW